ncbi:hypothetical protein M422DRAFT_253758 [Sphaerobolus stellatus SS14]|uniref:Uncharacterized protein n=1 Tax=Sphaerobolus stellatus (strain SS14) TaxID=990650 RepID=A0A0C9UIW9_SPHS4|nr:hypothetical protein M422DRAFT_253758 [Sphaerobolus stellatus SS14]
MIDPAFEHYTQWFDISDAMLLYPSISGHNTWLAGIMIVLSILQLGFIIFLVLALYGELMAKFLGTGIGQYNFDAISASFSGLLLKLHFTLATTVYT